jgi:hypothetical protein
MKMQLSLLQKNNITATKALGTKVHAQPDLG